MIVLYISLIGNGIIILSKMNSEVDDLDERQRSKNKKRLQNQNTKLNQEIRKLEQ